MAAPRIHLRPEYDVECSACGNEMTAEPSLLMELGVNSGQIQCTRCNEYLHISIEPDLAGSRMVSEPYAAHMARARERTRDELQ